MTALAVQLLASALTIAGSWFYGNKSPLGPWLGIASQIPWNIIMVSGGLWGLAPVNIMMAVIHVRNLIKWRADARAQALEAEDQRATAVPVDHRKRRTTKAYPIIAGGELS